MNYFYRIRVTGIKQDHEEDLSLMAFSYGCSGLSEALSFTQPDLTFDPRVKKSHHKSIDLFFDDQPPSELYQDLSTRFSEVKIETFKEEHKDWLTEWKKGFEPFCLASPYWVVPSWLISPVANEYTLHIDPGMAFGTGTHATTQIAAHLLIKAKKQNPDLFSVLDVGTGTGILAILAQKIGFTSILGIDVDPESVRVATENVEKNISQDQVQISPINLDEVTQTYQVLIANIIDGVLIKLKNDLVNKVTPNGFLILSGILTERDDDFILNFLKNTNLKVINRAEKEGWVGYLLKNE